MIHLTARLSGSVRTIAASAGNLRHRRLWQRRRPLRNTASFPTSSGPRRCENVVAPVSKLRADLRAASFCADRQNCLRWLRL